MKDISRSEAIRHLREHLTTRLDGSHSLCHVAGEERIFCGGLAQWSDEELYERFPWIDRFRPVRTRAELLQRIDQWLLHRQHLPSGRLPCDVADCQGHAKPCHGWDEFYEGELGRFCRELLGEEVRVVPDSLEPGEVAER